MPRLIYKAKLNGSYIIFFSIGCVVFIILILWIFLSYTRPLSEITGWVPQSQFFDGVEMVLVPAGCFDMGRTAEQVIQLSKTYKLDLSNQSPETRICFDESFWIDKYLVTKGQFDKFGGDAARPSVWSEDNFPRTYVSWFEAQNFCILRGGRLPTEAEWEYAAGGPENWSYPWGDYWDFTRVPRNFNLFPDIRDVGQPAKVGSRPNGVSWIGAMDMVGNGFQLTSSVYTSYPYNKNLAEKQVIQDDVSFTIRGGQWNNSDFYLQTTYRTSIHPKIVIATVGFRCVLEVREAGT